MSAADRREAILAAALEVFSERGFHEASLEDVAARDGVSKALIYEHFESKSELQRALLDRYGRELLDRVVAAIAAAEAGETRMVAGVDAFLGFVEERRDAWRMLFRNLGDPLVADAIARIQDQAALAIAERMAEELGPERSGAELREAVAVIAQQLIGAIQALANWWSEHPYVPRERVLELAMDFAWVGLDRLGRGERWRSASR